VYLKTLLLYYKISVRLLLITQPRKQINIIAEMKNAVEHNIKDGIHTNSPHSQQHQRDDEEDQRDLEEGKLHFLLSESEHSIVHPCKQVGDFLFVVRHGSKR
jgi:hypothetical protein